MFTFKWSIGNNISYWFWKQCFLINKSIPPQKNLTVFQKLEILVSEFESHLVHGFKLGKV